MESNTKDSDHEFNTLVVNKMATFILDIIRQGGENVTINLQISQLGDPHINVQATVIRDRTREVSEVVGDSKSG